MNQNQLHYGFFDNTGPIYIESLSPRSSEICRDAAGSEFINDLLETRESATYNNLANARTEILHDKQYSESELPALLQTRHTLLTELMNYRSVEGMPQRLVKYYDSNSEPEKMGDGIRNEELFGNLRVAVANSEDELYSIMKDDHED